MKLRNKKTGEIVVFGDGIVDLNRIGCKNVAEMMEQGWEDYEEPKVYYYLSGIGAICECEVGKFPEDDESVKIIGNSFETKEEAEKAVEKLKAWKRLKDKGFKFNGGDDACISYSLDTVKQNDELEKDFDLLFGGEE